MRLKLAVALIAAAATLSSAHAAGLTGMGANIFGSYFNFDKANLSDHPVKKITAGKLAIRLSETRLRDVQKAFGGTIAQGGGASWLCYYEGGTTNWFISNALGGQEFVMMVAVEATAKKPAQCDASDTFAALQFDVPALGAKSAELKAHFGALSGSGKVAYRADKPGGYSDVAQYLGYVLKGGVVAGMGVGETSIPTAH
jgi:hypothetical protein